MKIEEKLMICVKALKELSQPKGAYDERRLIHAQNTIRETSKVALEALERIGGIKIKES